MSKFQIYVLVMIGIYGGAAFCWYMIYRDIQRLIKKSEASRLRNSKLGGPGPLA